MGGGTGGVGGVPVRTEGDAAIKTGMFFGVLGLKLEHAVFLDRKP